MTFSPLSSIKSLACKNLQPYFLKFFIHGCRTVFDVYRQAVLISTNRPIEFIVLVCVYWTCSKSMQTKYVSLFAELHLHVIICLRVLNRINYFKWARSIGVYQNWFPKTKLPKPTHKVILVKWILVSWIL